MAVELFFAACCTSMHPDGKNGAHLKLIISKLPNLPLLAIRWRTRNALFLKSVILISEKMFLCVLQGFTNLYFTLMSIFNVFHWIQD